MNIKDFPVEEYNQFIEVLQAETAKGIIDANDHAENIQKIIYQYVDIGYSSGLVAEEVVDFFCVSSCSVMDRISGMDDEGKEFIIHIFDRINYALFPKFFPES